MQGGILLLSSPTKYVVKDAARAVGRVGSEKREKVTAKTLSNLIGLPGLSVREYSIEREGEKEILHLFCEHEHEVGICSHCRKISSIIHDIEERCIRHMDVWGKVTFVHFFSRRFDCKECGKSFTEQLEWIEENRRQSRDFELYIYSRCKKSEQTTVGREEWLHPATVKEIFEKIGKTVVEGHKRPMVQVLGIDEISFKKRYQQFVLVLTDIERKCVITVLSDRSKESLEQWIDTLSSDERTAIHTVSIDMWKPYWLAVQAKLPQAKIVTDRFHMMKQLNERLGQLRKAIQTKADEKIQEALKGSRWILVKNCSKLTAKEDIKLREVLEASPELRTCYLLKEEFHTICEKIHDRSRAVLFLKSWALRAEATGNKYLCKFVNTLRNWWEEFLNYFDDHVTNGFVEGINRAIRNILHRACGYHVFDNFRLQVLVEHGGST